MTGVSMIVRRIPRYGKRLETVGQTPSGLARTTSECWLLRTEDGREIELIRREVTIAYRLQPALSPRPWLVLAKWSLPVIGLVAASAAVTADFMAPNSSAVASTIIDIPRTVPAAADITPKVIVQTRYITRPVLAEEMEAPIPENVSQAVGASEPRDVEAAIRQAFATNEAQDWANSSASGIVVVGALQIDGGRHCRDVAVLTRHGTGGDRTANNRYCQNLGGKIAPEPS